MISVGCWGGSYILDDCGFVVVEKVVDGFFSVRFFEGELSEGEDGQFCHL